eukprot:1145307-Pelagomonas_calceolata.AAC.4
MAMGMDWKSRVRAIIHTGDAPAHGKAFHDWGPGRWGAIKNMLIFNLVKGSIIGCFLAAGVFPLHCIAWCAALHCTGSFCCFA